MADSRLPVRDEAVIVDRGYFDFISVVALLFAAYAGAQLLVPDRTHGVLNVYFSRPLSLRDYLVAKVMAYAAVIFSFWLVPQVLLHLGLAALSREGFLTYLGETTDILWKVPLAALVYFASPIDLLPGIVVDDVAFALVALIIVIKFMPREVLRKLLEEAAGPGAEQRPAP